MKFKKIANIVFYKFNNNSEEKRQACIFYSDGTIENVSYEEGIDACEQIAKDLHITSKDAFKAMINNNIIHVMTGSELERKFNSFVATESQVADNIAENDEVDMMGPSFKAMEGIGNNEEAENAEEEVSEKNDFEEDSSSDELEDEDKLDEDFIKKLNEEDTSDNSYGSDDDTIDSSTEDDSDIEDEDEIDEDDFEIADEEELEDFDTDDIEEDIEDDFEEEQEKPKEKKGILGFLQRGIEKIKKSKLAKRVILVGTALAVAFGIYSCATRKTKSGEMANSNLISATTQTVSDEVVNNGLSAGEEGALVSGNNDFYDNYSYEQLLEVTENKTQKKSMKNLHTTITNFNGPFADAYVEKDKDIRAALSFDELVALQHAYNDYSKDGIKAYFNGATINAADMTKDYKTGTLQLMGAHVIETRENPVDMSKMLNDKKAKEFYKKYHEMFLAAKEATGDDKIAKVGAFRDAIRKDFPITKEVRTEGIMHADDYASIESYKLSVVPMIAASEMMFQNLETDNTLNDSEIDFLNDIGLCNYAQDKFDMIQTITLSAEEDNTNPLYEQYRNSIIGMMKDKDQYVTTDEHRDLSRLDAFDKAVNWHFYIDSTGMFTGEVYYTTETHTETNTWTTQQTRYREEVTTEEKEIPQSEKEKIDKQIAKENEEAKKQGEKEAEKKRKEMQDEADKDAEEIGEEVKEDEKDLHDKIDDANDQIDENNKDDNKENDDKVNEDDFGDHNVDFDDDHSDDQGNLDDSVEDITTDPSGDQTNEELPDPNKTGKDFDANAPTGGDNNENDNQNSDGGNQNSDGGNQNSNDGGSKESSGNQNIIEYEEPVAETPKSNEELVDEYVESLADDPDENVESYEYTK